MTVSLCLFRKFNVAAVGTASEDIAVFGAGRNDRKGFIEVVFNSRNFFLFNKNLAADGAMLAFGKTGFGAGRCLSFVDDFGMTGSVDYFLFDKDFTADGTVTALGKAAFRAGCGNSGVCYGFVSVRFNDFLLNKNHAAVCTMAALGKAD